MYITLVNCRVVREEKNGLLVLELPTVDQEIEHWPDLRAELQDRFQFSPSEVDEIYDAIGKRIVLKILSENMDRARELDQRSYDRRNDDNDDNE